jgi:crossover junction endodeoxyribonuclease RusA
VRITLPWPPRECSPNSRAHFGTRARATKAARKLAFWTVKEARIGVAAGDVPIPVKLLFLPPDKRSRDLDNLQANCKAYLDGIADALGVNDNAFRPISDFGEVRKGGAVVVVIGAAQ